MCNDYINNNDNYDESVRNMGRYKSSEDDDINDACDASEKYEDMSRQTKYCKRNVNSKK